MPFSATVNLGTVGVAITSVKLYGCTGNSGTDCTGCTALTGYENVSVSTFPLLVSGIPNGVRYIQAEALGACSADLVKQCISISGIPGPTATPVPTMTPTPSATTAGTTPNPTSTQTPTPTPTPSTTSGTTPNPTSTQTPTPTATVAYGCGDTVSDTYIPSTFTTQTKYLDLSDVTDGDTVTISFSAADRPNRFNIYGNGLLIENSGWVGADNTYAGPWGSAGSLIDADGNGSFTFEYQSGMSYELRVDIGPANPDAEPANPSDGWSVTIGCTPAPTESIPPVAVWEYGTSVTHSRSLPGEDPSFTEETGTLTVSNGTMIFTVTSSKPFNYDNISIAYLEVSGVGDISIQCESGQTSVTSSSQLTVPAGTYTYYLRATLDITGSLTQGVAYSTINEV